MSILCVCVFFLLKKEPPNLGSYFYHLESFFCQSLAFLNKVKRILRKS